MIRAAVTSTICAQSATLWQSASRKDGARLLIKVLVKYSWCSKERADEADLRSALQCSLHPPARAGGQVETIRVSDELNVDLAPDGTIYRIELLNANEQLRAGDDGRIIVVDEAKGEERALALASEPRP